MAALQGKLGSLERQIRAAQAAGADVAKLREELGATRAALAEQEKKMAAVAAAATKAAKEAAALAVQPAFTEVGKVREVAKQAVAIATAADQTAGKVNWLWGALIGFVLLFGFMLWRIMRQAVNQKQLNDVVTAVEKKAKHETTKQFTALNKGVRKELAKLEERVEDVAEKAGVNGPDLFEKHVLKAALAALAVGKEHVLRINVEEEVKQVTFTRLPDEKFRIRGIQGQVNSVSLGKVVSCIYHAVAQGRVDGVLVLNNPPTDNPDTIPGAVALRAVA